MRAKTTIAAESSKAAANIRRSGTGLNTAESFRPSTRRAVSAQVWASMSGLKPASSGRRSASTTAVSRPSLSSGNRRSNTAATLRSPSGSTAQRPMRRMRTTAVAMAAAASITARTEAGGSKNQSAARLAQNMTPSQATAAAAASIQT